MKKLIMFILVSGLIATIQVFANEDEYEDEADQVQEVDIQSNAQIVNQKSKNTKKQIPSKKNQVNDEADDAIKIFLSGDLGTLVGREYGKLSNTFYKDKSIGIRTMKWQFSLRLFELNADNNVEVSGFGIYVQHAKIQYQGVRVAYLIKPKLLFGLGLGRFSTQYLISQNLSTILETDESIDNRAIEVFIKYQFKWGGFFIEPEYVFTNARVSMSGGFDRNLDMYLKTESPPDKIGLNVGYEF